MTAPLHRPIAPLLVAILASLCGQVSLLAQQPKSDRFAEFDKDKDGKVTREEASNATWFDALDLNRDGFITRSESAYAARSKGGGTTGDAATDATAYRADATGPVPLSESKAFTDLQFTRDWIPGTKDRHGKLMTGTECNYLVAHGGRLYAAVSVWNHDPAAPNPGPGVLMKRAADAPWEVDVQFHPRNVRVPVLASLTFTTDQSGAKLDQPVSLLLAGSGSFEIPGTITVMVRDDAKNGWMNSTVASVTGARTFEVRHLFLHRDKVTGADRVLAAVTSGSVFSGVYDPAAPGSIRWNPEPELAGRKGRLMSIGSANGDVYLAVDITPDAPKNGGLFRRVDGPQPQWEWIGEWGHRRDHRGVAWARGLTSIPDPQEPGKELLLCSREVDGVVEVIDPQRNHEPRVEFDLRKHFGGLAGAKDGQRFTTIFAYNEMTPALHPVTGERVHLIGGGIMPGLLGDDPRSKCAWFLIRHADGRYGTGQIFDPTVNPPAVGGLRSARTVCVSPFPEDKGRVFYFGGFDAAQGPHRDTAWIYKGTLPTAKP